MSENNNKPSFEDFLKKLDDNKYFTYIMAGMYNKYMGETLSLEEFLDLPQVKKNFIFYHCTISGLLDQYFTKKILYHPNVMLTVLVKKVKKI